MLDLKEFKKNQKESIKNLKNQGYKKEIQDIEFILFLNDSKNELKELGNLFINWFNLLNNHERIYEKKKNKKITPDDLKKFLIEKNINSSFYANFISILDKLKKDFNFYEISKNIFKEFKKELEGINKIKKWFDSFEMMPDNFTATLMSLLRQSSVDLNMKITPFILKSNEYNEIYNFPNLHRKEVPVGSSEKENKEIKNKFTIENNVKSIKGNVYHWDWLEKNNYLLKEESAYISGTRQVIYKGKVAQLVLAIEKFMIDEHSRKEWEIIDAPVIVNKETLFNTGQLPKFEDDLYKLDNDKYLIPTAEVTLTNLIAKKIQKEQDLPLKFTSLSNCFRKEAGAAGKDTRGIIRLHQFRKVELVTIGKQEDEDKDFEGMWKQATTILTKLGLHYRVIELCTGDLSFSSKKTYDLEVWMAKDGIYREISSVSMCGDFQARRMKAKYKDKEGKKKLVYTYNGSALAVDRTLAAIIETYVDEKGILHVPKALHSYLNFKTI